MALIDSVHDTHDYVFHTVSLRIQQHNNYPKLYISTLICDPIMEKYLLGTWKFVENVN